MTFGLGNRRSILLSYERMFFANSRLQKYPACDPQGLARALAVPGCLCVSVYTSGERHLQGAGAKKKRIHLPGYGR